jgi:hypothetical protein
MAILSSVEFWRIAVPVAERGLPIDTAPIVLPSVVAEFLEFGVTR